MAPCCNSLHVNNCVHLKNVLPISLLKKQRLGQLSRWPSFWASNKLWTGVTLLVQDRCEEHIIWGRAYTRCLSALDTYCCWCFNDGETTAVKTCSNKPSERSLNTVNFILVICCFWIVNWFFNPSINTKNIFIACAFKAVPIFTYWQLKLTVYKYFWL